MLQLDNYYFSLNKGSGSGGAETDERFKQTLEGTITELDDNKITKVGKYAFSYCNKLTSINLPNATELGEYAFNQCDNVKLTNISFPNVRKIEQCCFRQMSITSIDLPKLTETGYNSFMYCRKLVNVNIPNVIIVDSGSFQWCSSLATIDLPKVNNLGGSTYGGNVFNGCSALKTIILRSTTICSLKNTNVFKSSPIATSTEEGFIYVPDELVEEYKVGTNWATYASKIKPISELPTGV